MGYVLFFPRIFLRELVRVLTDRFFFQTKVLYVASMNDPVVPIYSGLFIAVSHPLILRALYIDGDAHQ
jgi:hypothetical protein